MTPSEFFARKVDLPTDLRTRELARLPLQIREQAFFMAGVVRAETLSVFRSAAQDVLSGKLSEQEALRQIREGLTRTGYRAGDGQEGTIKDLNTVRRQLVSLRTSVALASGYGAEVKALKARAIYPAKELVRASPAAHPRRWETVLWPQAATERNRLHLDLPKLHPDKMIAPVGDPIWIMLSDFGAPYDPLKWGSGMRQRPVGYARAKALGLLTPPAPAPSPNPPEISPASPSNAPEISPPSPPLPSPGASLAVTPQIPTEMRPAVERSLRGLAVWEDDKLLFTDPNGTRPWTPVQLAPIIRPPNLDGTDNYQRTALAEWLRLGGNEDAVALMRSQNAGTDLLDDWHRLTWRLQQSSPSLPLLDLLASLASLLL